MLSSNIYKLVCFLLVFPPFSTLLYANLEGDALMAFKNNLADPNNLLQNWDPTLVNPCTWFNVTCNSDNSVVGLDLGNAALSGQLVPQLADLKNLQYLELYNLNLSGPIPSDFGNLTNLVSLKLNFNSLTGSIPDTLGKLSKLQNLSLDNNSLSGSIPMSLTNLSGLKILDLSNNRLAGEVPSNGSFAIFTPISFANNEELCGPVTGKPCPGSLPFPPPPPPTTSQACRLRDQFIFWILLWNQLWHLIGGCISKQF